MPLDFKPGQVVTWIFGGDKKFKVERTHTGDGVIGNAYIRPLTNPAEPDPFWAEFPELRPV